RRRLRELAAIAQQVMRPSARLSLGTCATPAAARAEAPPLGGRSLHANFLRSADRSPVAPLHAHRSPVHVRSRRAQVEHRWHHGRPAASPAPRARGDDAGTAAGPRRTHRVRGGACPGGRGALPEASGRTSEQKARRQRPGGAGPDGGRAFRAELLRAGSATYQGIWGFVCIYLCVPRPLDFWRSGGARVLRAGGSPGGAGARARARAHGREQTRGRARVPARTPPAPSPLVGGERYNIIFSASRV
ncbi:unnamed protein product, partial [Prorocentrum cordatum]